MIAPHGAGLSNLLACRGGKHVSVIEFLAHDLDFNTCYLSLASVLDLDYHPFKMEMHRSSSYYVDVPHVVQVALRVLCARKTPDGPNE